MTNQAAPVYETPASREIAAILGQIEPALVARIAESRGLAITDPVAFARGVDANTANFIAAHVAAPEKLRLALRSLSTPARAVLRTLWRRGPRLDAGRLLPLFQGVAGRDALDKHIDELVALGLILPTDRTHRALLVPAAVQNVLLGRTGQPQPLAELLNQRTIEPLRKLCVGLGIAPTITLKADRIAAIVAELSDGALTRARIAALPDLARDALQAIAGHGGAMDARTLYQAFPRLMTKTDPRYAYGLTPADLVGPNAAADGVNPLEAQALVLRQSDWSALFVISDEVLSALQPRPPLSAADFTPPAFIAPAAELRGDGGQRSPALDIVECLQFVDEARPSFTQKGRFAKPDAKRLSRWLSVREPVYADFVLSLTWDLGLLKREAQRISVRPKKAQQWLELEPLAQAESLFLAWLSLATWRDHLADAYERSVDWFPPPALYRIPALDALAALPAAGATLDSLAARLRFQAPGQFEPVLEDAYAPQPDRPTPEAVARGVVRALAWLGVVEPLLPAGRGAAAAEPVAVRMTPLGRVLREPQTPGAGAENLIPLTDRLIVQPTLDVLAPPNFSPADYRTLRRFSEPRAASGMRTLTLTAPAIRRAVDDKLKLPAIRAFLEKHSDAPLPGTVESLLGDVKAKHGRIHIGNASHYLTVDDPHLLVELKADKKLNELRFHTLSPTVALVQGQNLARIRDLLHSAGHMPVADGYLDPPTTGDADGPDLPFADGGDDDDYVIDLDRMPTEEELAALAELAGRGGALSLMPTPAPPRPRFTEPLEATTPVRGRAEIVALLNTALDRGARVELEYRGRTGGFAAKTLRKVDVAAIDEQYVFGYCHLRHDDREFEIKRISAARLTGEPSH